MDDDGFGEEQGEDDKDDINKVAETRGDESGDKGGDRPADGSAVSSLTSTVSQERQQRVRERNEACTTVVAALVRSRRAIADMAGARIAALLQASSAPSSGHFRAVLDWARAFIEAAEAFSGTQAATLRGHLERAGDRYFESLHAQRLEALRQMLDREVWMRLPEAAADQARADLRAAAARGGGDTKAASSPVAVLGNDGATTTGAAASDIGGNGRFGVAAFGGVTEDGSAFESMVQKGNPFTQGGGGAAGNNSENNRASLAEEEKSAPPGTTTGGRSAAAADRAAITAGVAPPVEDDEEDDEDDA